MKGINTDPQSRNPDAFAFHPAAYRTMLGFIYTGLFLSISATITPLITTEMFSELALNASRKRATGGARIHDTGLIKESLPELLKRYGISPGFRFVQWHCMSFFILNV